MSRSFSVAAHSICHFSLPPQGLEGGLLKELKAFAYSRPFLSVIGLEWHVLRFAKVLVLWNQIKLSKAGAHWSTGATDPVTLFPTFCCRFGDILWFFLTVTPKMVPTPSYTNRSLQVTIISPARVGHGMIYSQRVVEVDYKHRLSNKRE